MDHEATLRSPLIGKTRSWAIKEWIGH